MSDLVRNPVDRFSHDTAHIILSILLYKENNNCYLSLVPAGNTLTPLIRVCISGSDHAGPPFLDPSPDDLDVAASIFFCFSASNSLFKSLTSFRKACLAFSLSPDVSASFRDCIL